MTRALRALIVDDSEDDALLVLRDLARSGFKVTHRLVQTQDAMREALAKEPWDVVLSDYSMPAFSAGGALQTLKESGLDLPFIILSGSVGEESAVSALKAGAHDFLLKHQLARLAPALDRELREAEGRKEKHKAIAALRESELKYRRIVEAAHEGIWMVDADANTTFANRRMGDMLGSPPDALVGKPLLDFVGEESKDAARRELEQRGPGPRDGREFKFQRADGSEFWARVSISPILDDDDRHIGALAMVTDVVEQKKLQAQLVVSDRMASIGTLAAGVAHEINNPLAAVLANLQLGVEDLEGVKEDVDDSRLSRIHEGLCDALDAAERVRSIVRDLKVLSRAEDQSRSTIDVQRVVESSLRMVGIEVRQRARVVKDLRPLPLVLANESRLVQVCINLLVNAAQAMEEGRADTNEIRVSTYADPSGRAVVEVQDTGAGMPPEVLARLFTPFFTTKAVGVGTGLGLSICQRIIASYRGEITVESTVGEGSTFRVSLPAAPPDMIETPTSEEPEAARPTRRGRILVVDDEPGILMTLRRMLVGDHDVTMTTSALDALNRIAAGERYDVILCDLVMPHVSGRDFERELRRIEPEQARRIVFLTGGPFSQRPSSAPGEPPHQRLEKPFDQRELKALIRDRLR